MTDSAIPDWESLATEPLDVRDSVLLQRLASIYDTIDPVPDGLVERVQFGLSLDAMHAELAELQLLPAEATAARGALQPTEVKTLTFSSDSLSTMVTISPSGPDRIRIDGWSAPGGGASVELRQGGWSLHVDADVDGRFVFEDVPHGMTRFVLRAASPSAHPPVVTPAVEI